MIDNVDSGLLEVVMGLRLLVIRLVDVGMGVLLVPVVVLLVDVIRETGLCVVIID